jgi:hypothetical protein
MKLQHFLFCPDSLMQAIHNFAKDLESWPTAAMTGFPEKMVPI